MEKIPAIRFENITKTFGSKVVANKNVTMEIEQGEIMALLGENGSGKTTLMNMLSGIYRQDEGVIYINGEEAHINSPKDAYDLGIGMIHQHFKLVDVFTAIENIALGMDQKQTGSNKEIADKVKEICDRYGFDVDPKKKVYNMSVSEKQTLEIVKTLYRGANILILDEPTAVLTPQETDKLFAVMRNMKADGKSIIIITHKLNEVLAISDRVAILRKGEYIGTVLTAEASVQSLTDMMVGAKVELDIERPEVKDHKKRLSVSHLTCLDKYGAKALDDVSFDAYGGEILGIAGISGSGQKQLLEAIAGLQPAEEGSSIIYMAPESDEKEDQPAEQKPKKKSRYKLISILEILTGFIPLIYFAISGLIAKKLRFFKAAVAFTIIDLVIMLGMLIIDLTTGFGAADAVRTAVVISILVFDVLFIALDIALLVLLYQEKRLMIDASEDGIEGHHQLIGRSVGEIKKLGVSLAFVPEDRLGMGLVGSMGMSDNMMLRSYKKGLSIFTDRKTPRDLALKVKDELEVVTPGVTTPVRKLSGGNVQKVLVGREIALEPTVMMAAYAVRGLDINTSYTIYHLLNDQKKKGTAVIYVGEDLDVLLALCDRIAILCDGKLNGIVDGRTVTKEEVGMRMTRLFDEEQEGEA